MLQHFQIRSLYNDEKLPGWIFSFYYERSKYNGIYHANGDIEWSTIKPSDPDIMLLAKQIHDLMIFHVYDEER